MAMKVAGRTKSRSKTVHACVPQFVASNLVFAAMCSASKREVGRESFGAWSQISRDEAPKEGDNEEDQPGADSCLATSIRGDGRSGGDNPCCSSESAHRAEQQHRLTRVRGVFARYEQDDNANDKTQCRDDLSHPEEGLCGKRTVWPTVRIPMNRHVLGQVMAPGKPGQEHDERRNAHGRSCEHRGNGAMFVRSCRRDDTLR